MVTIISYFTRPSCQLCADALPMVKKLTSKYGLTLEEHDIDQSDELTKTFGLRIPAVVSQDGTVLAEGLIERRPLKKALRNTARG